MYRVKKMKIYIKSQKIKIHLRLLYELLPEKNKNKRKKIKD